GGHERRAEVRGPRAPVEVHDPDPYRGAAAEREAQHEDEDQRQQHREEQGRPVARRPEEVRPDDREDLHANASAFRARTRPRPPTTTPIPSRTSSEGRMSTRPAAGSAIVST